MTEQTDTLDRLQADIAIIEPTTPIDHVALTLCRIDAAIKRAKELKDDLEKLLMEWIPANGGELVIGDVRYFVAPNKKVKCRDIPKAIAALMDVTAGDFDEFCSVLSANALKHGAAKKVLGDRFNDHFETIVETDLEHKPIRTLQSINARFVK